MQKRTMMMAGVAALMGFGLAACAPDEPAGSGAGVAEQATAEPVAKRSPVAFTATEFSYAGPDTIDSGKNQIEFTNEGKQSHSLLIFKLGEGKTPADIASMPPDAPVPDWLSFAGGIGGIEGGKHATAVLDFTPGSYALLSFESGEGDEVPDVAKGMLRPLTVTASTAPDTLEPVSEITIDMADYKFDIAGDLKAGTQMVKFINTGPQVHEAIFMRLAEGVTATDFVAMIAEPAEAPTGTTGAASEAMTSTEGSGSTGAATEGMTSTEYGGAAGAAPAGSTRAPGESAGAPSGPPVTAAGGMGPLSTGATGFTTLDLAPGNYMIICFVPDSTDGKPHAIHGMVREVTVQ